MNYKILALFFLLWFGILIVTGALFSGFHFTDDHEVIRIAKEMEGTTIGREARIFVKNLFSSKMRFRPFYMLHRRVGTAVLGTNFFAWSVYFGLLAVFTSFFLFLFMRKTGFYVIESFLFACLTLLGEQAAVWWKLGTNETLGMFMLSAAMYFMAQGVYAEKRNKLYNILFIFFTILASWSKESFILIIPALVFWQIWLSYQKFFRGSRGAIFQKSPPGRRRQIHFPMIATGAVLLLVCAVELSHIVKNVGTTGIKYAGYEGFSLSRFIKTFIQLSISSHGWVIILQLGLIIFILLFRMQLRKIRLRDIFPANFHWAVILFGLIVVPQVVLYMKSGIMERYLLPGVMAYTFLMMVLLKSPGIRMEGKTAVLWKSLFPGHISRSWPAVSVILLLSVVFLQSLRVTRYTAIAFAHEGTHTNGWFQSIKQDTRESDFILVITHPVKYLEPSVSLKAYLSIEMNRENIWFSPAAVTPVKSGFLKSLNKDFPHRFSEALFSAVLVFPSLEDPFLQHSAHWFNAAEFKRYSNEAGFVSYYKKGTAKMKNEQKISK